MNMEGEWASQIGPNNKYQYNGKELNDDFGLNWLDFGKRFYDAAIGRFPGVDPISDQYPHLSTYNYADNNPSTNVDLHGLQSYHSTRAFQREQLKKRGATGKQLAKFDAQTEQLHSSGRKVAGGIALALSPIDETVVAGKVLSKIPGVGGLLTKLSQLVSKYTDDIIGAASKVVDGFSDDLVKGVNKAKGSENCELCADAVDARLKGNADAVAGGDDVANIYGVNTRLANKFGSPEVTTTKFGDITQMIDGLGDGSTGIVTASGNPGHAFNIARLDGKVKILDGQTGDVISPDQFKGFLSQFGNSTFRLFNTTGK